MSDTSQRPEPPGALSDEDLQDLARRHAKLLRRFLQARERQLIFREAEAKSYSMAQNMAAMMLYQRAAETPANSAPAPRAPAQASPTKTPAPATTRGSVPAAEKSPGAAPKKVDGSVHFDAPPPLSETAKMWKKIGGFGLSFSLLFHIALIVIALFWVVASYVEPPDAPPEFFATGSGGGRGGERPSYADVQSSRRKSVRLSAGTQSRKIVSKVAKSKFVLPELPDTAMTSAFSGNNMAIGGSFGLGGDLSSGSGGGLGGGVGTGTGIGIGNARNFVSKFKTTQKILGTNVTASRLAVYMDASGSMTEVLPVVRDEILKKFPTADVYEFMGCGMSELNAKKRSRLEEISWNSKKKSLLNKYEREKKPSATRRVMREIERKNKKKRGHGFSYEIGNADAWKKALSSYGQALLEEWAENSASPWFSLGQWLDMVFTEGGYDSIIVFADFQDYRDGWNDNEAALFDRWLNLARKHDQRVYFFSTEMLPQNLFRSLAEHTGGDIAIPKNVAKNSAAAKETEAFLEQVRRLRTPKGNVSALSAPGRFEEAEEFSAESESSEEEELLELE